jgi:tetratricopeptide (TPR) repeat protein
MKNIFLILCIMSANVVLAQKMPSDYFEEAGKYFEEKEYEKALSSYQYLADNHPKNELYPRAFYNVGYIHFIQKNYEKATQVFKTIIGSNFNEKESLGGGIMDDPYANFKHRASQLLSDIYYDKQDYKLALYYFLMADTLYPYLHFCGNEYASNDIQTALRYADIFQKLNQPNKAIEKLLPTVFITLADNSEVIKELKKLLNKKKNLIKELDISLVNIYPKTIKKEDYTNTSHYLSFLNTEIQVPNNFDIDEPDFDKNIIIKKIKQSEFYKMIEKL